MKHALPANQPFFVTYAVLKLTVTEGLARADIRLCLNRISSISAII